MDHVERQMSQLFKALGDENRIKILEFLRGGERCVCEIVPYLGTTQSNVSQHLRVLRDLGIIAYRKDGKSMYYHVEKRCVFDIIDIAYKSCTKRQ